MSNYNNFSKMFHARCKNLYLTHGVLFSVNFSNHRAAPITRDPIADSPDKMTTIVLSSAERKYGFHFLFILVFWRLFRNKFPKYTVRHDFQRKIYIFMKFPNGSIVSRNATTRKFFANGEPMLKFHISRRDVSKFNTIRPKMAEDFSIERSLIYRCMK